MFGLDQGGWSGRYRGGRSGRDQEGWSGRYRGGWCGRDQVGRCGRDQEDWCGHDQEGWWSQVLPADTRAKYQLKEHNCYLI